MLLGLSALVSLPFQGFLPPSIELKFSSIFPAPSRQQRAQLFSGDGTV